MKIQITKTFECDDKIVDSIILLNEKGYETKFCCSGHNDDDVLAPYVSFDPNVYWVDRLNVNHPDNWECTMKGYIIRRFTIEDETIYGRSQLIDIAMNELYKWALSLPEVAIMYNSISINKI